MAIESRGLEADQLPKYVGCGSDCVLGEHVLEMLTHTAQDHPDNLRTSQAVVHEAEVYLSENPCDHAETGRCRLVDYFVGTTLAAKIILEEHQVLPEKLIRGHDG